MARRVAWPVPFMMVAKTEASGGGFSSPRALEDRDWRGRENSCQRWLPMDPVVGMVGAIS